MLSQATKVIQFGGGCGWMLSGILRNGRLHYPVWGVSSGVRPPDPQPARFPSPSRRAERPIPCKVTRNQLRQEGLKTGKPFCGCLEPVLLPAPTHLFHTWQQPLTWEDMAQRRSENPDDGRWKAIRHPWLSPRLDLHCPNKNLQSGSEPKSTSILYREQVVAGPRRIKSSMNGAWKQGICVCCSLGQWGLRENVAWIQSMVPKVKTLVHMQTNNVIKSNEFVMLDWQLADWWLIYIPSEPLIYYTDVWNSTILFHCMSRVCMACKQVKKTCPKIRRERENIVYDSREVCLIIEEVILESLAITVLGST